MTKKSVISQIQKILNIGNKKRALQLLTSCGTKSKKLELFKGIDMKLAKALEEKMLDVRLVDRLLAEGKITKAEVDAYMANLEDDEGNYETVE